MTDWMAHLPKEVLAKNFQTDESAFAQIPGSELYIFPGRMLNSLFSIVARSDCLSWATIEAPSSNATAPTSPQGQVPSPYTYKFSAVKPQALSGGSVKIADSTIFNVSTAIAVAEVTVEPGAMRELHVRFCHFFLRKPELMFEISGTLPRTNGVISSRDRVV